MLGVLALLVGAGAMAKDSMFHSNYNASARSSAAELGRYYYTDSKGKTKRVSDNLPVYVAIRKGDICVFSLDGGFLKNLSEEGRKKEAIEKEKRDRERGIEIRKRREIRYEKERQEAIQRGDELYVRSPYKLDGTDIYHFDVFLNSWCDVNTGEYFIELYNKEIHETYFVPMIVTDYLDRDGNPWLGRDRSLDYRKCNCYKYVYNETLKRKCLVRVNHELKGLIID